MKKYLREFKEFASKGNVFDLAVAVIIGGAFGKIVTSFVNDLFMPIVSLFLGKINLTGLKIVLIPASEADGTPELAIKFGMFLQTFIDFILIAFIVFLFVKLLSRFKKKQEPEEPKLSKEEQLLTEIRDILKEKP